MAGSSHFSDVESRRGVQPDRLPFVAGLHSTEVEKGAAVSSRTTFPEVRKEPHLPKCPTLAAA